MDETTPKPTSRALPIGVAAGLAFVVFVVLFAVRGGGGKPGEIASNPEPAKPTEPVTSTKPPDQPPAATPADAAPQQAAAEPAPDAAVARAAPAPDSGVAAPSSGEPKLATLVFAITPKEAAAGASIQVDGKDILGGKAKVPVGSTSIKVVVR